MERIQEELKRDRETIIPPTEKWLTRTAPNQNGWVTESHPSYGTIGVHRVSGDSSLFQSDVKHMHYICLEIHEANKVIDGTHEFLHNGNTLCTVEMSEAQFSQMITQPNMGSGTPCTIHYSAGDKGQPWLHPKFGTRPEPPDPESFNIKYDKETAYRAKIITDNLVSLQKTLGDLVSGLTKPNKGTLKELLAAVESARMQIEQNIPYVQKCAAEELEKKVGAAVADAPVLALEAPASVVGAEVPRLTSGTPEWAAANGDPGLADTSEEGDQ